MLLLVLGIFLQTGCLSYKHAPLSYRGVQQLKDKKVQLYLIDNENVLSEVWALKSYSFDKNEISCKIEHLDPSMARDVMLKETQKSARKKRNHVHLFATPALVQQLQAADSVTFDYHLLDRVEVQELNIVLTIFKTVGVILLIGLAAYITLILIALIILAASY
jgi:hypothetical protein